jgi:hypothetical protein
MGMCCRVFENLLDCDGATMVGAGGCTADACRAEMLVLVTKPDRF